jgi:hypothetical protein
LFNWRLESHKILYVCGVIGGFVLIAGGVLWMFVGIFGGGNMRMFLQALAMIIAGWLVAFLLISAESSTIRRSIFSAPALSDSPRVATPSSPPPSSRPIQTLGWRNEKRYPG